MGIIRLLLALSVVISHCGNIFGINLISSQTAVQSFYIISGFYMSLILNEKYIDKNNSFKLFITNRLLRLYPIYWTVLMGTILANFVTGIISSGSTFGTFDSYLLVKSNILSFAFLLLSNIFIFGQDIIMFLGIIPDNGNLYFTSNFWLTKPPLWSFLLVPQAWTLGLELTFYLIAPLVLKKGLKVVVTLILCSLFLRFFIYDYLGLQNDPWTYRFFPTEIIFFLIGYLCYKIYLRLELISIPKSISILTLLFILLFTFLYSYFPSFKVDYIPFSFKVIFYILSITASIPILFKFLRKNSLDIQIGELSYPVYISHILVYYICSNLPINFVKSGWAITLFTLMFSFFLNKFIALPIEKYRQSRLKI